MGLRSKLPLLSIKSRELGNISRLKYLVTIELLFIFVLMLSPGKSGPVKNPNFPESTPPVIEIGSKQQIQLLVDNMWQDRRGFIEGIKSIKILQEDIGYLKDQRCSGHVIGMYYNDTIIIKDSGAELNQHTFYHEIGHNVWDKLSLEQKNRWLDLHFGSLSFVTEYASYDPKEDFAESFACYLISDGCVERLVAGKLEFLRGI